MGKIDTVIGLERSAMGRTYEFKVGIYYSDGYEVLLIINGKLRRMAFCKNLNDAKSIVDALRYARENEVI